MAFRVDGEIQFETRVDLPSCNEVLALDASVMIDMPIKLPKHHSTLQAIRMNEFSGFPHWNLAIFRISGAPSALAAAQTL